MYAEYAETPYKKPVRITQTPPVISGVPKKFPAIDRDEIRLIAHQTAQKAFSIKI